MAVVKIIHLVILHLSWKTQVLYEFLLFSVSLDDMIRLYIYFHNDFDGVPFV